MSKVFFEWDLIPPYSMLPKLKLDLKEHSFTKKIEQK
jgi:hypothetical protein